MRIPVAPGGTVILKRGEPMHADRRLIGIRAAARALAPLPPKHAPGISPMNRYQDGLPALQAAVYSGIGPYPPDVPNTRTEGMIGHMIGQELRNLLLQAVPFATILTLVREWRLPVPLLKKTGKMSARGSPAGSGRSWPEVQVPLPGSAARMI